MSAIAYERQSFPVGASFANAVPILIVVPPQSPIAAGSAEVVFMVAADTPTFEVSPDVPVFVVGG